MNKKGESDALTYIIVMFVVLIIGLIFVSIIGNLTTAQTEKQTVTNESINVASAFIDGNTVNTSVNYTIYAQSDWKKKECPLSSVALRNGAGTSLTSGTDYLLYANDGVFSLKNTTKTIPDTALNLTYADSTHCPYGYMTGADKSLANLWTLMFILAVLGVAVGGAVKFFRK